ncbi:MAG: oligosaccharide flippase family protein [Peptostreptococcaceae bacterium]|nr:oligosaccharide flippase family protein [Peptostreptococcaceae bacterium]
MNNKKNFFFSASIIYIIGNLMTSGLAFIVTPIFSRLLTPSDFGIASLYNTWLAIFTNTIFLQTYVSLAPKKNNYKSEEFNNYTANILSISTICFFIFLIMINGTMNYWINITSFESVLINILLIHSYFLYVIEFSKYYTVQLFKPYKYLSISSIYSVGSTILAIILIFNLKNNLYYGRILGFSITGILLGLYLNIKVIRLGLVNFKNIKKYHKECLRITIPEVFSALGALILTHADRIMLKWYFGYSEVAIYSLAYSMSFITLVIWSATNNVWVPWYFKNTKLKLDKEINIVARKYIIIIALFTAAVLLFIPEFVKIMAPGKYYSAGKISLYIIVGLYFYFLTTFLTKYQLYLEKNKSVAIGTIMAAILNIILNIFLIPRYGNLGAAIATLLSYVILFIFHNYIIFKLGSFNIIKRHFFSGIWIVLASLILSQILYKNMIIRFSLIFIIFVFSIFYFKRDLKNILKNSRN